MFLVLVCLLVCPWLVGERDSNAAQSWEGPTSSVAGDGDAEESSVVGKPLTGALATRQHWGPMVRSSVDSAPTVTSWLCP